MKWFKKPQPLAPQTISIEAIQQEFLTKCRLLDSAIYLTEEEKVGLTNNARETMVRKLSEFTGL